MTSVISESSKSQFSFYARPPERPGDRRRAAARRTLTRAFTRGPEGVAGRVTAAADSPQMPPRTGAAAAGGTGPAPAAAWPAVTGAGDDGFDTPGGHVGGALLLRELRWSSGIYMGIYMGMRADAAYTRIPYMTYTCHIRACTPRLHPTCRPPTRLHAFPVYTRVPVHA